MDEMMQQILGCGLFPLTVAERRNLALLALDQAGEAARMGDHAAAGMFLADAELHLHALIWGERE